MSTTKLPLVIYADGERKVVGEAVVETDPRGYFDITGVITDEVMLSRLSISHDIKADHLGLLFESKPDSLKPVEASVISPMKIRGVIPGGVPTNGPVRGPERKQRRKGR